MTDTIKHMVQYEWEDFEHPNVIKLREEFDLEGVVSGGKSEFEKQLLLKNWVFDTLPRGNPTRDYSSLSAFEILNDAIEGKPVHCSQYAFSFLQCSVALGWYSRKLGVDIGHTKEEKDEHHGIADIWSNDFKKWYVVDAMFNLHYEKDSIPLNALEIRNEYLKNGARDIRGIVGNSEKEICYDETSRGNNTPSNYFWFFVSLRNNFFESPGMYDTKTLLWVDDHNKGKIWYKLDSDSKPIKHPMYESQFIVTSNAVEIFPDMST